MGVRMIGSLVGMAHLGRDEAALGGEQAVDGAIHAGLVARHAPGGERVQDRDISGEAGQQAPVAPQPQQSGRVKAGERGQAAPRVLDPP